MNKKIKNATPNEYNGISFRSKLEMFTYKLFLENGIPLDYEAKAFDLIPSFIWNGKKVRPMTYTPDFISKNFVIECKGFGNDVWPVKEKLFKWLLARTNSRMEFYVIGTQKEAKALLDEIKEKSVVSS